MPFVFLLLFALVCFQTPWPQWFDWPTPTGSVILTGTLIATSWLSAWLMAKAIVWQMTRHPEQRSWLLRRYARFRRWHFIGLLVAYLATLYLLGWGRFLEGFWKDAGANLPGLQIALLAPFFLGLVAAWERFFGVEKIAYEIIHEDDRFLSKSAYLLMQVRHQFFLVVPPILLMVALQALSMVFPEEETSNLPTIVMVAVMAAALILMPVLLRLFLGLKPLPPGPLRDRLESTARRLHFRYSNVLIWNTRHLMANALVTGFVPWIRYIVLTDRLIDELTPEEIEAVFGHEVGHIKHHHLFFYLAFFLTSFLLLSIFWDQFKARVNHEEVIAVLQSFHYFGDDAGEIKNTLRTLSSFGKLAILAGYTLLFFGFISRRCERQADLYGSHAVSTDVFIDALEKVALINGIPRDRTGNWLLSWQHPTIAQRVDFLRAMRDDPARIPQFHRSIMLLKWSFFLSLAFLVCWFGSSRVWELLKEF